MSLRSRFTVTSVFQSPASLQQKVRKSRQVKFLMESLEDRAVPAVITWDGGAGTNYFWDKANWSTDTVPGKNDDVIVPAFKYDSQLILVGDVTLRSIRSDAQLLEIPRLLPPYNSAITGSLTVTAGSSTLTKGILSDLPYQPMVVLKTVGAGTSLAVGGEIGLKAISTPIPANAYTFPTENALCLTAESGSKLILTNPTLTNIQSFDFHASGANSRIEVQGMANISVGGSLFFSPVDNGVISFPDLNSITLQPSAISVEFYQPKHQSASSVEWFQPTIDPNQPADMNHCIGTIDLPKLTKIEDLQQGRQKKTEISLYATDLGGSVFNTPLLASIRNVTVNDTSFTAKSISSWNAPKLSSFIQSELDYNVAGQTMRLANLADISETSVYVTAGYVEFAMQGDVKLDSMNWDTTWQSSGPLSGFTIQAKNIRGNLGAGHFFHIEALNGGLVNMNATSLIDDYDTKPDGGIYLKADTSGVLQINVNQTSGTVLDLKETGIATYNRIVNGQFKSLRGWDGKTGQFNAANMKTLTVDTYLYTGYTDCFSNYTVKHETNFLTLDRFNAPKLETVLGGNIDKGSWTPAQAPVTNICTWDGGAGNNRWADPLNWSGDQLPGIHSSVVIPAQASLKEILVDVETEVAKVQSDEPIRVQAKYRVNPITFCVNSGTSVINSGLTLKSATIATKNSGTSLDLYGQISIEAEPLLYELTSDFWLYPLATPPTLTGFQATNGSWLTIHTTKTIVGTLNDFTITATGGGSKVMFPDLQSVQIQITTTNKNRSIMHLTANDGGAIELPQLQTLSADGMEISIQNGRVNSPVLNSLKNANINIIDTTDNGTANADWICPSIAELNFSNLQLSGSDLVFSFNKARVIDGTNFNINGSKLYLPSVDKIEFNQITQPLNYAIPWYSSNNNWVANGPTSILEVRANSISGIITTARTFDLTATNKALISLYVPSIKLQLEYPALCPGPGLFRMFASSNGIIRAYCTEVEGIIASTSDGGIIAMDQLVKGQFRQILAASNAPNQFYAASLTSLTINYPDLNTVSPIDFMNAPKLTSLYGRFQAYANPFPLLSSITGSLKLLHQPGTPVSQVTVFSTPAVKTLSGISVSMEPGVTWPELNSQPNWDTLTVNQIQSDGTTKPMAKPGSAAPSPKPAPNPSNPGIVTWDGGAGTNRWGDAANWSGDQLPSLGSEVVIPAQSGISEILVDQNVDIARLTANEPLRLESKYEYCQHIELSPMMLRVNGGASVINQGVILKWGILATQNSGTSLDIYGQTKLEASRVDGWNYLATVVGLQASNGSWLTVHDTKTIVAASDILSVTATGGGAKVMFPDLVAANLQSSAINLSASGGGAIEMPQLKSMSGDSISIVIQNSWITTPLLAGLKNATISITDTTDNGVKQADWIDTELGFLDRSSFTTTGADITFSFPKVKSITQTSLSAIGSKLYFPGVDKVDFNLFYPTGDAPLQSWTASGSGSLLEVRANSISGNISSGSTFIAQASQKALLTIYSPTISDQRLVPASTGGLYLKADTGGVLRAYNTATSGTIVDVASGGAVAMDQAVQGQFKQIRTADGRFYASAMTSLTITEPDTSVVTPIDLIVAPKVTSINGRFQAYSNPFPVLSTISGSLKLLHQTGTPVSQVTIFNTPAATALSGFTVTMEQGVSWPQLLSQQSWLNLTVNQIQTDGTVKVVTKTTAALIPPSSGTVKAASVTSQQSVTLKPTPKPKVVAKPVVVKKGPVPVVVKRTI